jgi:hypothetical protein
VASAFREMMRHDWERLGLSVARASWLVQVSVRRCERLEMGEVTRAIGRRATRAATALPIEKSNVPERVTLRIASGVRKSMNG